MALFSRFEELGEPRFPYTNRYFEVVEQDVAFIDSRNGSRVGDGIMNYVKMNPGALVVCVDGDSRDGRVLLAPQERYTVNLIEGQPVRHYELPGGGFDDNPHKIIENGARELHEEFGVAADHMEIVGPMRGHLPHPTLTDRNVTVLAHGIHAVEGGAKQDISEAIGDPSWFSWDEVTEMYLSPQGLQRGEAFAVISSEPTIASIGLAHAHLAQREVRRNAAFMFGYEAGHAGTPGGQYS